MEWVRICDNTSSTRRGKPDATTSTHERYYRLAIVTEKGRLGNTGSAKLWSLCQRAACVSDGKQYLTT